MATSKRALYKPATQDISVPKERRRTLAQGRPITNPTAAFALPQKDENLPKDDGNTNQATRNRSSGLKQGQAIENISGSGQSQASLAKTCGALEFADIQAENAITPRKLVPQLLMNDSPKLAKPTTSLDLTDTEEEREESGLPEVIVVDASRQIKSLDDTEVDISMSFAQSPAKVICHNLSKVHSDLRNTGNVEQAARVCADKVPSVCILDNEGNDSMRLRQQTTLRKVPTVVRESGIVGKRVDYKSLMSDDSAEQMRARSHLQALLERSDQGSISHQQEIDSSDQGSECCENDPTHSVENLDRVKVNPNTAKSTLLTVADEEECQATTKRKAPRIVASRYLQAVSNPRHQPLKATDRDLLRNTNLSNTLLNASVQQRNQTGSSFNRRPIGSMKKHTSAVQLSAGGTPDARGSGHGGVSSSTPKADETLYFDHENVDVSAIVNLPNRHGGPFPRLVSADGTADYSKLRNYSEFDSGLSAQGQKKKSVPSEISQWTLELLYARHLQWAFLATKARKMFRDQQKQGMEQLNSLVELNNNQDERIAELELELEKLHHINCLDEALELQYSGLGSSADKLHQLKEQHHHLAQALDTTRHHIPTKDIYIPDNEEQYVDGIARALQESEQLLGEISAMTRSQTEDIDQCAKVLQAMEKVVDREMNKFSRCNTLLNAAVTLTTQENSLMVQQIQTRP